MFRKIEIFGSDQKSMEATADAVGPHTIKEALSYLSLWALRVGEDSRPEAVEVYFRTGSLPDDLEIVAHYYDTTNGGKRHFYTIGAIWRPDSARFSFHS